jgi:FlaA1/EpsC-like NDP-sugar epimerase
VIVGEEDSLNNIRNLLNDSAVDFFIIGRVSAIQDDFGADVLGNIGQLKEIIRVNRIDEVILSARGLSASQIINSMQLLSESNIKIHIAPAGEKLIIGSKSINQRRDIFALDSSIFRSRSKNSTKDFNE